MREHGAELWSWLEAGAHFYVCGDASRMARDVDAALKSVVTRQGGMSDEEAQDTSAGWSGTSVMCGTFIKSARFAAREDTGSPASAQTVAPRCPRVISARLHAHQHDAAAPINSTNVVAPNHTGKPSSGYTLPDEDRGGDCAEPSYR